MSKHEVAMRWRETRQQLENIAMPGSVAELIDNAADSYGDSIAWNFFERNERYTFKEVRELSCRSANMLASLGMGKGKTVGVMVANGPAYFATWFGMARLGGAIAPINTRYTSRELAYVLNSSDAELLIIEDRFLPIFEGIEDAELDFAKSRVIVVGSAPDDYYGEWWRLVREASSVPPVAEVCWDDVLNIQFTSGTTGFPKGCMLPQIYWINAAVMWGEYLKFPLMSVLCNQNVFYLDGQFNAMVSLYRGAEYFVCSTPSAKKLAEWLEKYKINYLFYFDPLFKAPPTEAESKNELKLLHIFGFSKENHRALEVRYGTIAREGFGMTEFAPSLMMPLDADEMVGSGSCGLEAPFSEVRIVDDNGAQVARGEVGEFIVRSRALMKGYYGNPDATSETLRDGWLYSGDLFTQDDDGFYYIVGRKKDMIRRNAENIACREVEEVLRDIPQVKEAAAVPVKDEIVGEEVKVYIQLLDGVDAAEMSPETIIAHCQKYLASFKLPRYFEYVQSFPMTESARVEKKKIIHGVSDLRINSYDRVDQIWR